MSTSPRTQHELPAGRVELRPPPEIEQQEGIGGILVNALPMLGSLGSIVLIASMAGRQGTDPARSYVAAGMFLLATLGFVVVQLDRQRRRRVQQVTGARRDYLRHLDEVRGIVRDAAERQRRALTWRHPRPAALAAVVEARSRRWQRADDSLAVRWGISTQPLSVELVAPQGPPVDRVDPASAAALHRFLSVYRLHAGLPATLRLHEHHRIEVRGSLGPARALVRAIVCSAAGTHPPDRLLVAVLTTEQALPQWDWLKWLPHASSTRAHDAAGARRLVVTSPDDLVELLPTERATGPHVLLVTDGVAPSSEHPVVRPDAGHRLTVLDLTDPDEPVGADEALRLELAACEPVGDTHQVLTTAPGEEPVSGLGDQCDTVTAEAFARRLAPLAASGPAEHGRKATDAARVLGLAAMHTFEPSVAWRSRPARDRLRVPIGVDDDGAPVHLDLKESAQHGMGPHGLVVGATGSGKSELLRSLVLTLAATHSPEQLNLVLVDFKGGATFAGMAGLPHVSAVITNLASELPLVDRMQDALFGELLRRQQLLREAGNLASTRDHEAARAAGAELAPLPSLLVVVDEFGELLSARPEFLDLFVAIGRLGRSLGLHLLLASQRLEEGRLRGLESHLSYRIGLRTFSASESRAVLGVPDAHELPAVPGMGFLRSGPSSTVRFTAACVSGPADAVVRRDEFERAPAILPFTLCEVPDPANAAGPAPGPAQDETGSLLDLAVARMTGQGPAAHQVWLPPLDAPDTLDRLLPDLAVDEDLGLVSRGWRRAHGALVVPLGTLDRPREQRREPLTVDLRGATGHVAVVGAPRSGRSTLLRTLVTALSLTTTPREARFFLLDFGGGTLAQLARLPHVAGVATRAEPEAVSRTLAQVRGVLDRREAWFRQHGIEDVEAYRARRAAGRVEDGYGDVFLVVDGWTTLRSELDEAEVGIQQLAARGLTFGVHLVAAASRWADFRSTTRDVLGTRLELRLGDPADSEVDRRSAGLVPVARPGRGLVPGGLHFLAALPRIDARADPGTLAHGVGDLVDRVSGAWHGPTGPALRLLPDRIALADVRARAADRTPAGRLWLGIDQRELAPVGLDPDPEPHLLVLGDGGSGKSSTLRAHVHEVIRTRTPAQAQLVVVDYRRSLLGEVPDAYLLHHLSSAARATPGLNDLADHLQRRLPGEDVAADELRDRSWWKGAEVFVVVDDYDLVATQHSSPVAALQPLLAQAGDVGLHLAVARRSGGASRAMYEPVLQTLRDLAVPTLLLSGSPDEGPLVAGVRAAPARPGRGRLVTRDDGVETVQVGWIDPVGRRGSHGTVTGGPSRTSPGRSRGPRSA